MQEIIVAMVEKYGYWEMIAMGVGAIVSLTIAFKVTSPDYHVESDAIRSKYKKRVRKMVRNNCRSMVIQATKVAREVIKEVGDTCDNGSHACGLRPVESQLRSYTKSLKLCVLSYLIDAVLEALLDNGFSSMTPDLKKMYLSGRGTLFFGDMYDMMLSESEDFPDIMNSKVDRFSSQKSIDLYTVIVSQYEDLKFQEKTEINLIKKKYTIRGRFELLKNRIVGTI